MTPELKTKTEIESMVGKAVGGYCAAEREMHEAVFQATLHALTHGDVTLLTNMLVSLGRKQVAQDLAAWVRHFGNSKDVKAITAKKGKTGWTVKVGKVEDRSSFPLDSAFDTPYYTLFEGRETKTAWEMEKALLAFCRKAVKEGSRSDNELKGLFADTLKKAHEKAA